MSNERFKLPPSLAKPSAGSKSSDALDLAKEKTLQEQIKRETAFSGDRAQVLTEGIGLLRDLVGVLQSAVELKKTSTEWKQRVKLAEKEVQKAQADLEKVKAQQAPELQRLNQVDGVLTPVLKAFEKLEAVMDPSLIDDDHQRQIRASIEVMVGRMVDLVQPGKR
ncbi:MULTISPECIES: hypothetical protein [Pseudomonas]|jgi:DNA repair exonuclease SbcCD ATPase subunit|uniref:hypothetical protein n=1 Tax=Pseudomonas TaxID=286 RepID=UPI000F046F67|nr:MULTISPECIES: hypothetical protein [Pseudomonas]NVZ71532.1 hypothetical protein [Pseudomonas costantinii]